MTTDDKSGKGISNRVAGLLLVVCGLVLLYVGIIEPIYSAAHDAKIVGTYLKAAIGAPVFLAAGLVFAALGDKATLHLGTREKPSVKGWVFYVFFGLVGVLAYVGVQKTIEGYGYVFH